MPVASPADVLTSWEIRYARAVVTSDVASLGVMVAAGHVLGLGNYWGRLGNLSPTLGLTIALVVILCLYANRAWDARVLGFGSEEISRLLRSYVTSAVLLGLIGLAAQLTALRPWVFGLVPAGGALALTGRFVLRKLLHRRRAHDRCVHMMLAVGTAASVSEMIKRTRRDRYCGWSVAGACTPTGTGFGGEQEILGVRVVGDLDSVAQIVRGGEFRVVAVGSTPGWTSRRLHQLAWDLEDVGAELVVDPGIMEVAGPRLHVAPVDGLPLLRLTEPAFTGLPRLIKWLADRVGGMLLLLVLLPVLLVIAVAVKVDGGPVFYRQARVGRHGHSFKMVKFRSMVVDADHRRAELVGLDDGAGPLFKMRNDPRVTRVGAVLRKYSLDELPQLLNVLSGSMSLIGPRPPLAEEVAKYERDARRKLLVKPGLTGLWQVSGRSDLSWDESVRLDLRYVENWTLALDALILWKTLSTVIKGTGAY